MSNGPRPLCFVQVAPVQACPALGSGCLPACGTRDKSFLRFHWSLKAGWPYESHSVC